MKPAVRQLLFGSAFTPERLFRGGEQGFFFDPYDPSTAYQDSAGTTAGVVAQPVGLRLDKRLGAVRSGELLSNNNFASAGAGWSSSAGVSFAVGSVSVTAAGSNQPVCWQPILIVGEWYAITYTISAISAGSVYSFVGNSSTGPFRNSPGTYTEISRCLGNTNGGIGCTVGTTATVTSISYQRLAGNHSTQSTSASRPVWAQDGSGFYRDTFDGFDDSLTIAAGGGSTTGFFYCAAINVAGGAGTARTIISDTGTNAGYRLRINATNQLELAAGNGVAFTSVATVATLSVGSTYVVTAWDDGVNLNVQVNQGAVASVARPVVSAGTATMTEGKDNGAASSFANAGLYSRVYRTGTVPDATQRAQIQRFNASRAGVQL